MLGFNFLHGNFLNSPQAAQTDENYLKIESRKGDLYGVRFDRALFKTTKCKKHCYIQPHFIKYALWGSLLFRLCGIEFVGNFRLFERSEFRKFPLSKFNGTKETRKSRVDFLFAYFFFGKAKKK
ncbi:hypothetical protein [Rodentibacter ratti]|uniref:hypothetical protein n=1 Tax=Rodentibacter ratti TaxID=1906745 RepID=UPI0015C38E1D|nr:hypothetical protein [Rodentibacter ratti]